MNIYVGHSRSINFKGGLYPSIRNSNINKEHNIVLPHEHSDEPFNSKDFIRSCGLMIAEVSDAATGLGIELGWANMLSVPIICIYQKGCKISGSLKVVSDTFIEYTDYDDLVNQLNIYF